jgi:hypothetical protein
LIPTRALAAAVCTLALLAPAPALAQDDLAPRYGDAGTSEISVLLGAGSGGWGAGAGFRYFVLDGVAPGLEGSYEHASGALDSGFAMASLRVVPLRFASFALVLTARGGRVFLSDHADGWAVGGDAGILLMLSPHAGLELGYEVLKLLPESFCSDLSTCVLQRPVIGVRFTF